MYLFKYFLVKIISFILYKYDHFWLTVLVESFLFFVNTTASFYYHDADFGYNVFCLDSWQFTKTSNYTLKEVRSIDFSDPNCKYTAEDVINMRFNVIDEGTVVQKNLKTEHTIYFCFFVSVVSLSYVFLSYPWNSWYYW